MRYFHCCSTVDVALFKPAHGSPASSTDVPQELGTLPWAGDRCWGNQSWLSSPHGHCRPNSWEPTPVWMCASQVWGCSILELPVKSSKSLLTSHSATSVQHGQDTSLDSTYFEQVLQEHLLTTNYLNSFFPLHPTNISPSQTQRVILYTVFEMYTLFSRSWLQGGQHTCRYFEAAKENKKDNSAENWSMTFLMCGGFFCANKDSIVWRICLQSHSLLSFPFFPFHPHLLSSSNS